MNTSIIHLYSTLPRNGRIHGLSKITCINITSRTGRFCSSRQDPKAEDRTGRVGRAKADRQGTDVGCPKPSGSRLLGTLGTVRIPYVFNVLIPV